ncbi:MAG: hypothetical protein PHZ09_00570 [Eubacteriales bacterium]|jgi:vacuolar-type H+-ATPase subunit H|nr:hypothetical protein [Eubacteriales bacterium]
MSTESNVIDKIKTVEDQALAVRQGALETAREINAEALRQAARIMERAAGEADAAAKDIISAASERASAITAAAAMRADEEAERIITETEPKLDAAASVIIERILK